MSDLFQRILVAVDETEVSHGAVDLAAMLAKEHGGTLTIVHAVDWAGIAAQMESGVELSDPEPIVEAMREGGRKVLAAAAARAKALGVTARERLIDDRPVDAVAEVVGEIKATLVVVGTHGRHGIGRLFLGSVAEGVLRQSTIPVLVTKA